MKVLGETKRYFHIKLSHCEVNFKVKFIIISGLQCNINISGPFLKRHQIDQIHSQDAIRIQGQLYPLLASECDPSLAEVTSSKVFTTVTTIVPPHSMHYMEAQICNMANNSMDIVEGLIHGKE